MLIKNNEEIRPNLSFSKKVYEKVDSDNGFDQYLVKYVYKSIQCGDKTVWRNKKTGEIIGSKLELHIWFYDKDWNYYPDGIKESIDDYEKIPNPDFKSDKVQRRFI